MPRADPHLKRCLEARQDLLQLEQQLNDWLQGLLDRDEESPWTPERPSASGRPGRPGFGRRRHAKRVKARIQL